MCDGDRGRRPRRCRLRRRPAPGVGRRRRGAPPRPAPAGACPRRVLAAARPDEPVADGDALVVATSGTTGEPKAAILTHEAVTASALATSARLGVDPATDRWLACLPLAHVGGLAVVTRALATGTPLTVHDGFDAGAVRPPRGAEPRWSPSCRPRFAASTRRVSHGRPRRLRHAAEPAAERGHHLRHDRDRQRRRLRRRTAGGGRGPGRRRRDPAAVPDAAARLPGRHRPPGRRRLVRRPATPAPGTRRPAGCAWPAAWAT